MEEIVIEPLVIEEEQLPDVTYQPPCEVAMFQVRGSCEEFSISGDKILFIPRIESMQVENPVETQEYPNSKKQGNNLIIKNVTLFAKVV